MGIFMDVDEYVAREVKTAGALDTAARPFVSLSRLVKGIGGSISGSETLIGDVGKVLKEHPYAALGIGGGALGANALHSLVTNKLRARKQNAVFDFVKKDDPILRDADRTELASAFDTFRAFAPSLATDPNAARSFLREAVTSGGGVNYNTINLLARTESAIQGESNDR